MVWTVKLLWRLPQSERLEETRWKNVYREAPTSLLVSGRTGQRRQTCLHLGELMILPSRCILGRNAPRQVVITVVTARVVKEIPSGGQDVVGYSSGALSTTHQSQVSNQSGGRLHFLLQLWASRTVKMLAWCRSNFILLLMSVAPINYTAFVGMF